MRHGKATLMAALIGATAMLLGTGQRPANAEEPEHKTEMKVHATATVEKVDVQNRELTLRGPEGKIFSVDVPEKVRRLDHMKPGDRVNVDYYRSVALALQKPGETPPAPQTHEYAHRAPGNLPGGAAAGQTTANVKVISTDPQANQLTVKTPAGAEATFAVEKPENQAALRKLHPGDQIQVTHTEAVAVTVTPAPQP